MNILNDLKNKYNLLDIIDISETHESEDQLYQILHLQYKKEFSHNDRIVLYFNGTFTYQYKKLPSNLVVSLQKTLYYLDIPNFFVTLLTGNPQAQSELNQVCAQGDIPILHNYCEDLIYNVKNLYMQDSFCELPWFHSYVDTNGDVLPCCIGKPLGNIKENNLSTIFENPQYQQLRLDMLSDIRNPACNNCHIAEDKNLVSTRQKNQKYKNFLKDTNKEEPNVAGQLTFLELSFDNTCNFKCRSCGGHYSSSIALEEKILYNLSKNHGMILNSKEKKEFSDKIIPIATQMNMLQFTGGEPTLTDHHFQILSALVEQKKFNTKLIYITNLSNLKYKSNSLIHLWKKFNSIELTASLDGCGAKAEYIRHGTKWTTIVQNYKTLIEECPNMHVNISSTVSLLSIESVIELQKTWINDNLIDGDRFKLTILTTPDHLSLLVLPDKHKKRINDLILEHQQFLVESGNQDLCNKWQSVLDFIFTENHEFLLKKFTKITTETDQYRGTDLVKIFPEYEDLLIYD